MHNCDIQSLNCAGPRAASKVAPDAPKRCTLRCCSCRFKIRRRKWGSRGAKVAWSLVPGVLARDRRIGGGRGTCT
eukprot:15474117-Alexandrium_andersonii.AAC.1